MSENLAETSSATSDRVDPDVAPEAGTVIRDCILCGSSDYEPLYTFTFDFLVGVRGQSETAVREQGWTESTTSTIVRCQACGCDYVRDCILPPLKVGRSEGERAEWSDVAGYIAKHRADDIFQNYGSRDRENWIVRNLVLLASLGNKRDIRFLDYGAGSCSVSATARAYGVRDVIAYDPFWAASIQARVDGSRYAGITCVHDRRVLPELGPFDAAMFQSAIEHVADPRGELETIFNVLAPGGYLYVNNPVMDLRKELGELKAAKTIKKGQRISHYHPYHINYMLPRQFAGMLREVGFEITPIAFYAPVPWVPGQRKQFLMRLVKIAVRSIQNWLNLPYERYVFVVRKPLQGTR